MKRYRLDIFGDADFTQAYANSLEAARGLENALCGETYPIIDIVDTVTKQVIETMSYSGAS